MRSRGPCSAYAAASGPGATVADDLQADPSGLREHVFQRVSLAADLPGHFDPAAMSGFDQNQFGYFDPGIFGGFNAEHFLNFDPALMSVFDVERVHNFDPLTMGGFDAEQFANFDPVAMFGFDAAQVGFFDPQAFAGFERNHVTGMELGALAGFDVGLVRNLEPDAIHGIGDKVPAFDDFDFDDRKELVEAPGLRLGGVGSFDDLVNRLVTDAGTPPTAEELQQLGWDSCLKSELDFGSLEGSAIPEGFSAEAMSHAMAAFGAAGP